MAYFDPIILEGRGILLICICDRFLTLHYISSRSHRHRRPPGHRSSFQTPRGARARRAGAAAGFGVATPSPEAESASIRMSRAAEGGLQRGIFNQLRGD